MRNIRKMLWAALAIILTGLIIITLFLITHKDDHGRVAISTAYSKIHIPSSLAPVGKHWDDRQTLDPAINSAWNYTYAIKGNQSASQIQQELKKALETQGYTFLGNYPTSSPQQYSFSVKDDKLEISILVGYTADAQNGSTTSGNQVLVTAEKAE
jgi:hypothetical protein